MSASENTLPTTSKRALNSIAKLHGAATRSLSYHDLELVEAIFHHCALRMASATAPTDVEVGRYCRVEEKALRRLLRLRIHDLEGLAVKGRYLRALSDYDPEWFVDTGMPEALLAGMVGAA